MLRIFIAAALPCSAICGSNLVRQEVRSEGALGHAPSQEHAAAASEITKKTELEKLRAVRRGWAASEGLHERELAHERLRRESLREVERERLRELREHHLKASRQYMQPARTNTPDGVITHPKQALDTARCRPGGRWPQLHEFDLVISWWTNKNQSSFKHWSNHGASLLETGVKSGIENQAEVKYALRSFEKFGLLEHVNQVIILTDDSVMSKFGAPRFFNYSGTKIRVVTDADLGLALCNGTTCGYTSQWSKLLRMHTIPGLSDYFLWVPDDVFLMRNFSLSSLWDDHRHQPYLRSHGSWKAGGDGWCAGQKAVGALHGPVLLQKCAMQAVLNVYLGTGAKQKETVSKAVQDKKPIDAFCLFTRAMSSQWSFLGPWSRAKPGDKAFFNTECHTNDFREITKDCTMNSSSLFMNIQGFGVSDEYPSYTMSKKANAMMPNGAASYFHSLYPTQSRFEASDII